MALNWFKKKSNSNSDNNNQKGSDYSNIDSNDKAMELFENGELAKIYLMPLEFGGAESPMNSLFVPEFVKTFKQSFDSTIHDLLMQDKKLHYSANPEYKGKSFIPSKLVINVSGDADFNETINIW